MDIINAINIFEHLTKLALENPDEDEESKKLSEMQEFLFDSDLKNQLRDPAQLPLKYINLKDVDVQHYKPSQLVSILDDLISSYNNLGGLYDTFVEWENDFKKTKEGKFDNYDVVAAFLNNYMLGIAVIYPDNEIGTFVLREVRQQGIGTLLLSYAKKINPNIVSGPSELGEFFYDKVLKNKPLEYLQQKYKTVKDHPENIFKEEKEEEEKEREEMEEKEKWEWDNPQLNLLHV